MIRKYEIKYRCKQITTPLLKWLPLEEPSLVAVLLLPPKTVMTTTRAMYFVHVGLYDAVFLYFAYEYFADNNLKLIYFF